MSEIIIDGTTVRVSSGVVSSGLNVTNDGEVTVLSGGTVTDAEVSQYGFFWVEEGGYIQNIQVKDSGGAFVSGSAENLTMETGGQADIMGGVLNSATILSKGIGAVYAGASALNVVVSAGGRYLVYGGYAENAVISSGGSLIVQISGGLADKTTIEAGGSARIVSGGEMWETILNGARLDVISGTIKATTINGGELHLSSAALETESDLMTIASAYADNTVVNAGTFIVSGATAASTTVNSGGSFLVSGGTAQITTVNTGGSFLVSGGTAQNTRVSGGAFILSGGSASNTTMSGGAVQFIGGFADKTDIFSGTVVVSGGTVQNTTLGSGTSSYSPIVIPVDPDGPIFYPIFTSGIIFDPSSFIIYSDSSYYLTGNGDGSVPYLIAGGATVSLLDAAAFTASGGEGNPVQVANAADETSSGTAPAALLTLLNGALAVSTTVNSGGEMRICDGATASNTTITNGGMVLVSGGGIAHTVTMSSGRGRFPFIVGDAGDTLATITGDITVSPAAISSAPVMTVFEGGLAVSATVSAGLLTLDGGTASNTTIAGGTMHVLNGGAAFITSLGNGFLLADNGTLNGATITGGTVQILNNGTIHGATVTGGTVRIQAGGTLSGAFTVTANADVYMESGSVVAFDITGMTPGAEAESSGLANIWGAPSFTLTVSDIQAAGVYALSKEAAGFRDAITVQSQLGEILGTLTVGNTTFLNNRYYKLRVTDNVLNLTVANEAPARMWDPTMVFVNDAWASLSEGSTVEPVAGISATIGVDAFATGRDATNAVAGNGTVVVAGGEASFQYGITRDTAAWYGATVTGSTVMRNGTLTLHAGSTGSNLTVTRDGKLFVNSGATGSTLTVNSGGDLTVSGVARGIKVYKNGTLTVQAGGVCSDVDISASGTMIVEAGGYLTGTGKFASGATITVNGTINFDLTAISAGNSALFTGDGTTILGAPSFTITLSDSQASGEYSLVDFIPDLDGLFTILNVRGEAIGSLTVGSGVLIDGNAYILRKNGNKITLTISEAGDTNVLYVNTEWAELAAGTLVQTTSSSSGPTAIIGYDAFADLHTAEERLPEDGFIVITGGTYASETISIGITMDGGTISDSAITETGSLTLNNSVRASNLTVTGGLFMQSYAKASDLTVSGRLVMNGSSEAENITVTGNLVLNGSAKAKNLTAGEGAIIRGTDNAGLNGIITIGSGATLTGTAEFGAATELVIVIDGTWEFDITGATSGNRALFHSFGAVFSGTTEFVVTVSDTQTGQYNLASGIAGFDGAVFTIVNTSGVTVTTLAVGEDVTVDGKYYRLAYTADTAELTLTVANEPNSYRTYVNSAWQDKSFGDLVQTPDGAAIYGLNAFADLDVAQLSTSEYGAVFVIGGTFGSGTITRSVQVADASIANLTVSGNGTLTLNSGATAANITVSAGSLLAMNAGATLTVTSPEFFRSGGVLNLNGGTVYFDLSSSTPGDQAFADAAMFSGAVSVGAVLDETTRGGRYTLLSDAYDFNDSVQVRFQNRTSIISLGGTAASWTYKDSGIDITVTASLELSPEDSALQLVVRRSVSTVSLDSAWEGLEYGTVIEGTGIYGINAFSTMEDAWEAVGFGQNSFTIGVRGGTFTLPESADLSSDMFGKRIILYGGTIVDSTVCGNLRLVNGENTVLQNIVVDGYLSAGAESSVLRDITVNGTLELYAKESAEYSNVVIVKGGTLTGGGTFTENSDITVNGTLEFKPGDYYGINYGVYAGFRYLKGTPTDYTMTLSNSNGNQYLILARDVTDFDGSISIYRTGVNLGSISMGKTFVNNYLFDLYISEGDLRLDVSYSQIFVLNQEWAGLENGTEVTSPSGPILETRYIGVDAFGDADEALAAANGVARITLLNGGTYSFANVINTVIYAENSGDGGTFSDSSVSGTIQAPYGTFRNITILKGGFGYAKYMDSITVKSGGSLKVYGGATLTGFCTFEEGAYVNISGPDPILGSPTLDFDVTLIEAGGETPLYQGLSYVEFYQYNTHADVCITVSAEQEDGVYLLATGAAGFDEPYIVRTTDGTRLGTLTAGKKTLINGVKYLVRETDGNLMLTIEAFVPPETVYLNTAWSNLDDDSVVEIPGGTAVVGYDAFDNAASAISAAVEGSKFFIVAGSYKIADLPLETTVMSGAAVHDSVVEKSLAVEADAKAWEIYVAEGATLTVGAGASAWNLQVAAGATLTVEAGGKLTGWSIFSEGANITVNGTLDFDISAKTASLSYLYSNFASVQGTPNFTLTVRDFQSLGLYALATGVTEFNSTITVVNSAGMQLGRLSLGTTTRIGDKAYRLTLSDGLLAVTLLTPEKNRKCDVDGNGVSDVLFQYTGGDNQTGYWLNGKDTWRSSNCAHPVEWTLLGAYDMDGDGLADSVFVGNGVVVDGVKGAYIGYYKGGIDTDENWMNIDFLENEEDNAWVNKIGNLTGNPGANSIVWHCADLGAIGVWTDGTSEWMQLGIGFDSNWTLVGCGDFNGDGRDSIVMSYLDGTKYYAIDIDGSAFDLGNLNWTGWEVRAIGDFAGDGKDDMILFHKDYGAVVMIADGNLDNYTAIGQLDAKDWFIVGAGDYDGDGKDDLLVRQYSTGMLGYYSACDTSQWNVLGYGVDMTWTVIA